MSRINERNALVTEKKLVRWTRMTGPKLVKTFYPACQRTTSP